jgi:plasmid stabilization system protein ParE
LIRHQFHPEAEPEFIEAAARYEEKVPGLGKRFSDEVHRAIDLLLDNPQLGSPLNRDLRYFVLRRFPFLIIYSLNGSLLYILAVAHGKREPGYWTERLSTES